MSGSPVYIDGKLVGAISYSFPFSKEPICGITPIEQMIAIFEKKEGMPNHVILVQQLFKSAIDCFQKIFKLKPSYRFI